MPTLEFRDAIRDALDEELARDERVVFFGEDIAVAGGVFAVTAGLLEKHGPERVFDTPISELAITGAAFGSAVCGLRPVIEIMFGDFLTLAMDSIVNQAAKYFYISAEQASVPMVVRSAVGAGGRFGAIHSQTPAGWFQNVPGLKIVAPASPADAKALLKASIRDENPVLFLEHKRLYAIKQDVEREVPAELGRAQVVRNGADVTLVSAMKGVHDCLAAAEQLTEVGIDAEVIDLRTLRPLDRDCLLRSLARTNRLAVVEEGPLTGGWAAEIIALVAEHGLHDIDDDLEADDSRPSDPVQPTARGCVPAGTAGDRRVGDREARSGDQIDGVTLPRAPDRSALGPSRIPGIQSLRQMESESVGQEQGQAADRAAAGSTPRNGLGPEAVGGRVREERLRQKIGVRELARRVGVSASLISQVELGKASPSVGTLYAIVNELGLSLDELLFEQSPSRRRAGLRDAGARRSQSPAAAVAASDEGTVVDPVVRRGGGKAIQLASGVRWERLTPETPQDVDFLYVVYAVDGASCPEDSLMRHLGNEYGHVVKGRLGVSIGFETYELGPGDSISFESTMPHRLFNLGDAPVEAIWFVVGRRGDPRIVRSHTA